MRSLDACRLVGNHGLVHTVRLSSQVRGCARVTSILQRVVENTVLRLLDWGYCDEQRVTLGNCQILLAAGLYAKVAKLALQVVALLGLYKLEALSGMLNIAISRI